MSVTLSVSSGRGASFDADPVRLWVIDCPLGLPITGKSGSFAVRGGACTGGSTEEPGAGGRRDVGGGAAGGSEEDARGLPTCERGGVGGGGLDTGVAAYGCTEGATGVWGDSPPEDCSIAVPIASRPSDTPVTSAAYGSKP